MKVGKIEEELRNLIIQQNDLKEVAEEYGVVFGLNNKARCPFHHDGKNGNLHFHPPSQKEKNQTYHCYQDSCGAGKYWEDIKAKNKVRHVLTLPDGTEIEDGGPNVIGFVMNMERCSYIQACVILMNRAGIPIPEARIDPKEEKFKAKMTKANKVYFKHLQANKEMMAYLEERGINKNSIKKWRLGYVPSDDDTLQPFNKRVSGRLLFGLKEETYDIKGAKTVAFAYRAMTEEHMDDAKYLNDYTSEYYEKKKYLYGYNEARQPIRRSKFAIVMEGYTDVILAHQCGLENAVAVCGTSFTTEQMQKLRKLTDKLLFWLDGDGAGFGAMIRDIPMLLDMGFRVQIVMGQGKDPAEWMNYFGQNEEMIRDFLKRQSRPAQQVLSEMIMVEFEKKTRKLKNEYEAQVMEAKTEAAEELLEILELMKNPADKMVFRSMIEEKIGVKM